MASAHPIRPVVGLLLLLLLVDRDVMLARHDASYSTFVVTYNGDVMLTRHDASYSTFVVTRNANEDAPFTNDVK